MTTKAQEAISYALTQVQTRADFHYVCCPFTQLFALLCEAEAELTGRPVDEVRAARSKTTFTGKSRVEELQEKVEQLEEEKATWTRR
jgi:hypothetical protein